MKRFAIIKDNTIIDIVNGIEKPVYPFEHDEVIEAIDLHRWQYLYKGTWKTPKYIQTDEGFYFVRIADKKDCGTSLRLGLISKDKEDGIDNYKPVKYDTNEEI